MTVILETERLFLRTWLPKDVEPYHSINQDPKVIECLPGPLSRQEVESFISTKNTQQDERGYTLWAVELKENHHLIGFIGLNYTDWGTPFTPMVEIGWRLGSQFWGKGYATEGALASLQYGFEKIGLDEIVSYTVPGNVRSMQVMERIGLKRDINADFNHPKLSLDHRLSKHILYRLTKEQYSLLNKEKEKEKLNLKPLTAADIPIIVSEFNQIGWNKPASQFEKYLQDQNNEIRKVWVAWLGKDFAGYITLLFHSDYFPFKEKNIPEINDLNVLPKFRKRGIGSELLTIAENEAKAFSPLVGIGVGLTPDYGNAQKIYVKRGYIPDGLGITYKHTTVDWGMQVTVDDDLVLWFIKKLVFNQYV